MKTSIYALLMGILLLIGACKAPQAGTTPSTASAAPATPPAPPMTTDTTPAPVVADFRATAPEPGPAPEIQIGDFADFTLDNGLQVVLVENHKLPRVSYQLFVDVPPHLEGEFAGARGLLGGMLRRATSEMTKEEIDEAVDFIGASLSTSGSGAYASTITKYKEQVLELMAKVVLDAEFPESEWAKVKKDSEASLAQELTTPQSIASRVRQTLVYGANHPYGEQMTETTLEAIDLDVVKSVYDTYFVPNRSYLVMVGDLTPDEARTLAEANFSAWQAKAVAEPTFPTPQKPDGVRVAFVPRSGSVQSNVIVTSPIELQPGTKESIRADLLNIVLGSGFNGRLFANLREDKGYTYGAYSSTSDDRLVGNFQAYANVRNEVTDSAVTEFMFELDRIANEPVTEQELMFAQMQTAGSFGRALESPQRIASYALNTVRYGLDRDFYPDYLKVVQNTSVNDLTEVASDIVTPENAYIIVVGEKDVAEKLARFATSGKVEYYDVNGQPLDMEEMSAPVDLTAAQVIDGYFEAIGGKSAALALENVSIAMEASLGGQTMSMTTVTTNDRRMSTQMTMMGMVMMDQRIAGGRATVSQQGQPMPLPEEAMEEMSKSAVIFPEVAYLDMLEEVTVDGTEMVDGKKAIVLAITTGGGTVRELYDAETMLKLRTVKPQGPQTATITYGDYREVNGILFPFAMTMEGVAPMPLEMKATAVEVDTELDESIFEMD